jgi:hypothetical protein
MRILSSRRKTLKLALIFLFAAAAVFVIVLSSERKVNASASGPSPSRTNAPGEDNCTECHVDFPVNSGTGSVKISGVPKTFLPGQQIQVKVTTSQEDAVDYGFQLTAIDSLGRPAGTWTLQDTVQTQIVEGFVGPNLRQYVEHTSAGIVPTIFGSKSWTFTWNAPSQFIGKVGFYAAGNAVNGDGGTGGDYIYTTVKASFGGSAAPDLPTALYCFDRSSVSNWCSRMP